MSHAASTAASTAVSAAASATTSSRILAAGVTFAACTPYLPLGLQYTAYLGCGVAALSVLRQSGRLPHLLNHPVFQAAALLWTWLLLSAAWSPAPGTTIVSHAWTYSLMLWVTPIALACDAASARRALHAFVAATSVLALVVLADHGGLLPSSLPWRPFLGVIGNQRISFSLLLALSATLALHLSLQAGTPRRRYGLALGVALCLAGLALQDRRTGMLAAPVLLAALAMAYLRSWPRRLALLAVISAAAVSVWHWVPQVQQRFAEGAAELRSYRSDGDVSSSWGMRARMLEVTARMTAERPLVGHGLGSWVTRWRERVSGSAALLGNTTPHNEYLLLMVQGGLVALAALLLLAVRAVRGLARRGQAAVPAVLVLTAIAWAALFNVVLRDSKFALPLLTLSALAWAASTIARPARVMARAAAPYQAV